MTAISAAQPVIAWLGLARATETSLDPTDSNSSSNSASCRLIKSLGVAKICAAGVPELGSALPLR